MKILIDDLSHNETEVFKLISNNWDDFGYKTMFSLRYFDEEGVDYLIGDVKIGYKEQETGWTKDKLIEDVNFLKKNVLSENYFSLGQDVQYYENIMNIKNIDHREYILHALKDIADDNEHYNLVNNEDVFYSSLTREVHVNSILNQFRRVLDKQASLTEYNFSYKNTYNRSSSDFELGFDVRPHSKPPTNMHILIGKNGVGKTTLLNDMVDSLLNSSLNKNINYGFYEKNEVDRYCNKEIFSGVVSMAFSAFDSFNTGHTKEYRCMKNIKYSYIGLRKEESSENGGISLKSKNELAKEFSDSIKVCISFSAKRDRWLKAMETLFMDSSFKDYYLDIIKRNTTRENIRKNKVNYKELEDFFLKLSSGHSIILLSITKLVEYIEEKTLVLIDEPEAHLHPPLISTFIRVLSDLLINRNAVAIVATHSPVVLQEVPRSCVNIIERNGYFLKSNRPTIETFAENVGTLTREVFKLDVKNSGFHYILKKSANNGESYEDIVSDFNHQIGFEGSMVLRAILSNKDKR